MIPNPRCNRTHTFQKVQLLSHQSTKYLPKSLGDNQDIFGKCETSLCVLFGQQWLLPWNSSMDAVFAQSLSYWWIMNTDLNWGKCGLQFFRCCSGFFYDLLDESSLRSWSNFGRTATPGKVHHCYKLSPFVDNGSDRGSLESQSLRNSFISLSKLIHVNYFVSHLCLNFFRSRHDVLLFKHASLRQVIFKWFLDSTGLAVIRLGFGLWNLTHLSKIMCLITVLSWFNRRGQLIFHVGPGRFGQLFSLN